MSKISLTNLVNLQNPTTAVSAINANNAILTTALDNTLSRDGTSPNQMAANLDMNSNRILNLPIPVAQSEPLRLADVTQFTQVQNSVNLAAAVASANTSATNAAASQTAAATSATNAATSATNAATSASSASASASLILASTSNTSRNVRLATTANIALSGVVAIDGITPTAGDRVLVKNQSTASQNGVYLVSAGAWPRTTDFNAVPPVQNGAVVNVLQGNTLAGTSWVLSGTDNPLVLGTSSLTFTQSTTLNGDPTTLAFQQDGAGTVPVPVIKILKQWNTLQMYGGGPDKTSAQNAAAFAAARDAMTLGGKLYITPGVYNCDPVNFVRSDLSATIGLTIEGVINPAGGSGENCAIQYNGSGAGTFWSFDSPIAGTNNGGAWSLKNLYIISNTPAYSGSLISSTTGVTDGSKITFYFNLENCWVGQIGGATASCTLVNLGKSIEATLYRNHLYGGACQIFGQAGQTVAGIAQVRQSTTTDIRKCEFINCNGTPILWGGEGWGLYDNIFEQTVGGRGRAFSTNASYPIKSMTWVNNWFGDATVTGDQWLVVWGYGFNFIGNTMSGAGTTSSEGINLNSVSGFNITGNIFDTFSNAISNSGGGAANNGSIRGNAYRNCTTFATSGLGANTEVVFNGTYPG